MDKKDIEEMVARQPIKYLFKHYPYTIEFFSGIRIEILEEDLTLSEALNTISAEYLEDFGLTREEIFINFIEFIVKVEASERMASFDIQELTVLGGRDKSGISENITFSVCLGEIVGIVGPTGSGKSQLLGDIEALATGDTPTGRKILLNGKPPDENQRFSAETHLVAQLSQNMNFVMDLTVGEFLTMHAESRFCQNVEEIVHQVFECAGTLSGEPFSMDITVTQLSGGQSRALMIADTALLSNSPIVLIDEIENAGIDRRRALKLLTERKKIVLLSTHDPVLALMADKRIVIKNGGIVSVLSTSAQESRNLLEIERRDNQLTALRNRIRTGERIDFDIESYFNKK